MSPKAANHGGVRTLKNPDYVMSMLGADTSEGADKKKGIGELKMGCFNRPLCVRSPDFARQPRLPKGKKVKGKKVKSRYLQCAMLPPVTKM